MKRFIVTYILFLLSFSAVADDAPKIYLKNLQAYTLGYPRVEFYEAFLVTSLHEFRRDNLMQQVRGLCNEFPMIDRYIVRIFNDEKIADPQTFKSAFGSSIGGNLNKGETVTINSYVAEINPKGELILFPFSPDKKKVVNIGHDWCKRK